MIKIKYTNKYTNRDDIKVLPNTYEEYRRDQLDGLFMWDEQSIKDDWDRWSNIYKNLLSCSGKFSDTYWEYELLDSNFDDNDYCFHEWKMYNGFTNIDWYCVKCSLISKEKP